MPVVRVRVVVAGALFVSVMVAGCAAESTTSTPAGKTLADFAGCNITGPTGVAIDCAQTLPTSSDISPPAGWACAAQRTGTWADIYTIDASLWKDQAGAFGVWMKVHVDADHVQKSSAIHLSMDAAIDEDVAVSPLKQTLDDASGVSSAVFVSIPGTHADEGFWYSRVHVWTNASITGSLLQHPTWSVQAQSIDGNPWFWIDFDGTYTFPVMAIAPLSGTWIPANMDASGDDFSAHISHGVIHAGSSPYDARVVVPPIQGLDGCALAT